MYIWLTELWMCTENQQKWPNNPRYWRNPKGNTICQFILSLIRFYRAVIKFADVFGRAVYFICRDGGLPLSKEDQRRCFKRKACWRIYLYKKCIGFISCIVCEGYVFRNKHQSFVNLSKSRSSRFDVLSRELTFPLPNPSKFLLADNCKRRIIPVLTNICRAVVTPRGWAKEIKYTLLP